MKEKLLIGAHTSAAGGVHNALYEGQEIGATTIQLFTANQRQWAAKPYSEETVSLWHEALDKTGLHEIMSHASYLINLGCPQAENLAKSRHAFREEIARCQALKLRFLNVHPGSALHESSLHCISVIAESLRGFAPLLEKGHLMVLWSH